MKRETLAWVVLAVSFGCALLLAAGLATAGYSYWANATEPKGASLTTISGIVTIRDATRLDPVVAAPEQRLKEGETIATNQSSRAFVSLFDGSTVTLFENSELSLAALRSLKYRSPEDEIVLSLRQGKAIVGVAPPIRKATSFFLQSPHGVLSLREGSYSVDVSASKSELRVRDIGRAELVDQDGAVGVASKQQIEFGKAGIVGPRPVEVQLVRNSDFSSGLFGWQPGYRYKDPLPDVSGTVEEQRVDGRPAMRYLREGSRGTWSETFLYQQINRDVSDFLELTLSLEFRLLNQSVPGGGQQGSEYPLMVKVEYRSVRGDTADWLLGYYFTNDRNYPTTNGVLVPHDQWVTYTDPTNLLSLDPKPREILGIELKAAGHDYESVLRRVNLVAK